MSGLRSILFQDLGTKALALILALAAYVHVLSTQDREVVYEVPLRITEIPAGLALADSPPEKARVRVRASGKDLIKLRTRPFEVELSLQQARAGELQRPVLGSDVEIPRTIPTTLIEVLEPQVVHLTLEPVVTESKPVAVRVEGYLPTDRALLRRPVAAPARVRATGGRSKVAAVDSIRTVPIDLGRAGGEHSFTVDLDAPSGLSLDRETVTVQVETGEKVMRFLRFLPVQVVPSQGERPALLSLDPDSATIVLAGASSVVQAADPRRARLIAELPPHAAGAVRVRLRAVLPGVSPRAPLTIRTEPESVTVRLGRSRTGTFAPTSTGAKS
ncbi:MAG: YbbR-like domain-containing protein [Candidatus Eisenbacteria bacterium]|nr:CdaR family protein [Candidatus Eisenbacteria bacterium]